jgi:hypothetical protein
VSFVAVLNSSFLKKSIALILSSIFSLNSLTASAYLGDNDRVNAATPPRMERIQQSSNPVSPAPKVADVCLFGICAPINLPQPVEGIVNPLLDNVVKDKIRSLLADEIPINGSKHNFYKSLSTLPGNTFKPSTLYLTALSPNRQIPPGDYQIPVHFYCTGIYTFNGRGNRFALAKLNGRMADVLSALYTRASYQKQIPISDIQSLAWSIQSGMAYSELSPGHKLLVTQLIPEYRDRMERGFIERLEGISSQVSRLSNGRIPNLNGILNQLGPVGDIAQTALRARQEILRTNFKAQALAERFSPNRDFFLNGGTDKTPWSQIQNNVYLRFIAPSGAMHDGVVDVRVPNGSSISSKALLTQITKSVGVSEGSGGQGIQATVTPIPKDKQATLPPTSSEKKPNGEKKSTAYQPKCKTLRNSGLFARPLPNLQDRDIEDLYVKLLGVTDILNKYRQNFLKTNDFKDLFPLAYYNTTMEELKRIKQGEFTHPREKMEQMLAFFDAYEVNRRLWESGKRDAVEEHWNAHFRIAEGKTKDYRGCLGAAEIEKRSYKYCDEDYFYAVGDVLRSGIDAHVSHDLPRALRFTLNQQKSRGITPEALAGDFNQTNSTLQASSNQTSKEIFRHYKLAQWMDRHTREFAGGDNFRE